jgi:tetratricopeptide (TPR) repeat protein
MITKNESIYFWIVGLWVYPALAQQQDLQKAQDLFVQMEYDRAQAAALRVLENPRAQPKQVIEAYALIGFSQSADGKTIKAEETFLRLLALDPDYSPGDGFSPALLGPLEKVRKVRNRKKLELHHRPPEEGKTLTLEVPSNPFGLAAAARLRWKEAGASGWQEETKPLSSTGTVEFSKPETGARSEIEYQFQLLNTQGAAIKNFPESEPFRLNPPALTSVAKQIMPSADQASASITEDLTGQKDVEQNLGAAPVWYKSWWFWTAVGVVVAGSVTTGVLLGASTASGAADYRIIFR